MTKRILSLCAAGAALVVAAVLALAAPAQAAQLSQVSGFGSNPGNLAMYAYRPDGLPSGAPAVVLLHGCGQDANGYFTNSGWRTFADRWRFALVIPQQNSGNNSTSCFNWFETGDTSRGQGEAASIRTMVSYAVSTWGTAANRVYVSGLSAGGAMSAVMLATYPDVFAAGSIVAGIPYRCATSMINAFSCMNPGVDKTPAQWGDLARGGFPGYTGARPKVAIWHGTSDFTVATANANESRDQWTNVLGISASPTGTASLPGGTTLGAVRQRPGAGLPGVRDGARHARRPGQRGRPVRHGGGVLPRHHLLRVPRRDVLRVEHRRADQPADHAADHGTADHAAADAPVPASPRPTTRMCPPDGPTSSSGTCTPAAPTRRWGSTTCSRPTPCGRPARTSGWSAAEPKGRDPC